MKELILVTIQQQSELYFTRSFTYQQTYQHRETN